MSEYKRSIYLGSGEVGKGRAEKINQIAKEESLSVNELLIACIVYALDHKDAFVRRPS